MWCLGQWCCPPLAEQALLIVNFRLRVLKLVEAFVKRQPSSPWLLDIIVPLVRLAHRGQVSLSSRAAAIVVRVCKGKVPVESSQVALSALREATKLLYKGEGGGGHTHTHTGYCLLPVMSTVTSSEVSPVLSAAIMWLLKVVYHDGQEVSTIP